MRLAACSAASDDPLCVGRIMRADISTGRAQDDAGDAFGATAKVMAARAVFFAVLCAFVVAVLMVLGAPEPPSFQHAQTHTVRLMRRAMELPLVRLSRVHDAAVACCSLGFNTLRTACRCVSVW